MDNPFTTKPIPVVSNLRSPVTEPEDMANTYERINDSGHIIVCKNVHGVEVVIKDKGSVKNEGKMALFRAAMAKVGAELPDPEQMTHLEMAAYNLVKYAAAGDSMAIASLLDRILGKPTQSIEQKTLNVTIDDILRQSVDDDGNPVYPEGCEHFKDFGYGT